MQPKYQFQKQQALSKGMMTEQINTYECQPLQKRHSECCNECLDFVKRTSGQNNFDIKIKKTKPLNLQECVLILNQKVTEIQELKNLKLQLKPKINVQKRKYNLKKKTNRVLSMDQRIKIKELQSLGYKNGVISAFLDVTTSQVRQNKMNLRINKSREYIEITPQQKQWLIFQASSQSNSILFNAKTFHQAFKAQFPQINISVAQFRVLLKQYNIRYRVPSLKPLSFFYKEGKNEEMKVFISKFCGYLKNNYQFIFIDECSLGNISKLSHKQYLLGTFKQSTQRISSFKYLIGALGTKGFFYYQLFSGAGKAYIFEDFLIDIINIAADFF